MSKKLFMLFSLSLILTGCSFSTPVGNVAIDDGTATYTNNDGVATTINLTDASSYVDTLLDSVSVPGVDKAELKKFVYKNLDEIGIDLSKIDLSDTKKVHKAEKAIKKALKEQGIDVSNTDIDIKKFMEDLNDEEDEEKK